VRTEPYPTTNPTSMSFKETWGPCVNGAGQQSEVVLVSVTGMIHDWATAGKPNANEDPAYTGQPFDIDGSEEAWAYLKQHSLDGAGFAGADAGVDAGSADAGVGDPGTGGVVTDAPTFPGGSAAATGGTGGAATPPVAGTAAPIDEFIPGLDVSTNDGTDSSGCAVRDVARDRSNGSWCAWIALALVLAVRMRGRAGAPTARGARARARKKVPPGGDGSSPLSSGPRPWHSRWRAPSEEAARRADPRRRGVRARAR
jgi:hypothetical protein